MTEKQKKIPKILPITEKTSLRLVTSNIQAKTKDVEFDYETNEKDFGLMAYVDERDGKMHFISLEALLRRYDRLIFNVTQLQEEQKKFSDYLESRKKPKKN